jgi:branched-chain amino acid transport system permease protein
MTVTLQLLNGITVGSIYILLAAGLTIVFGLQGIVNIAHGVFYMLGAYFGLSLYPLIGFTSTLFVVFAAVGIIGLLLELTMVRPLLAWRRPGTHVLISTLAVTIIASEVVKLIWGPVPQLSDVPRALVGTVQIGPLAYPVYWLFVVAFTVALMTLLLVAFNRTTLGILVQSIALDSATTQALGTNAPRINSLIFALGAGIAGISGVLAGPIVSVYPTMCFDLLMLLFVIVILGGLGSLWGVIAAGLLVGLVQTFGTAYLSGTIGNIAVFVAMIIVLLFRPNGFFGREGILR